MTEATNTKLMDTSPGGENTQYESQHTFVEPPARQQGQFKDTSGESRPDGKEEKAARGEKTAENIRYGEAISEHGFGGETVGNGGEADAEGKKEGETGQMRREMGYGGGSGVGA